MAYLAYVQIRHCSVHLLRSTDVWRSIHIPAVPVSKKPRT